MNSEKVKEIKKALGQNDDNGIMYEVNDQKCTCKFIYHKDILTLINDLESENERFKIEKQKVLEYMKTDNYAKLKKEDMYWGYQMGIGMLEHEIDRQKDRIAELEKGNEALSFAVKQGFNDCQTKTLKQFAERLKEKFPKNDFITFSTNSHINKEIDETLKEFIDD